MSIDETLHTAIRDDLPGYALGALDASDRQRVAEHLRACADCRARLGEYEEVARLLPLGLPVTQPAPSTRAELLARARQQRWAQHGRLRALATTAQGRWLAAVAAALCFMLASVVGWGIVRDDARDSERPFGNLLQQPGARVFPMVGSQMAPDAMGQLIVASGTRDAGLIVTGLPQLPPDKDYQFWFVTPNESRISGAVFEVDDAGEAIVAVTAPERFSEEWRCGVTEEPDGGSPEPTGPNVLRAAYYEDYWRQETD